MKLLLITKQCPTQYAPGVHINCPQWLSFLDRIFAGNHDVIRYVQRLLGYTLTGRVDEHVLPIFWGNGANGKSTLLETMLHVLGPDYATSAAPDLLLILKNDKHPAAVADLFGRRFVVASESDAQGKLNESFVKRLTGGDKLKARQMYGEYFSFKPTHKVVLMTNHRPMISGRDKGIWRRIALLPFTVTITDAERDQRLLEKLKAESRGILAWCVEGCLAWQREGLAPPPEVQRATEEYEESQDDFGRWKAECCVVSPTAKGRASELYASYLAWCKENGVAKLTQPKSGEQLIACHEKRMSNGTWYVGIGIRSEFHSPA